jgi:hypothetical protein
MPQSYGLDQPMPQRYAYQILYPFLGERAHGSIPESAVRENGENSTECAQPNHSASVRQVKN